MAFSLGGASLLGGTPGGGGGGDVTVTLAGEGKLGLVIDKASAAPTTIAKVTPGGLAVTAKLQPGWSVIAINGQSVEACGYDRVMAALKGAGRPLQLTVRRGSAGAAAAPAAFGAFGAAPAASAAAFGAFGAVPAASAAAFGAFGAAPAAASAAASTGGAFGAFGVSPAASAAAFGAFGAAPAASVAAFGAFGAAPAAASAAVSTGGAFGAFGAAPVAAAASTGGAFGAFGAAKPASAASTGGGFAGFGAAPGASKPAAAASTGGAFGGFGAAPAASALGAAKPASAASTGGAFGAFGAAPSSKPATSAASTGGAFAGFGAAPASKPAAAASTGGAFGALGGAAPSKLVPAPSTGGGFAGFSSAPAAASKPAAAASTGGMFSGFGAAAAPKPAGAVAPAAAPSASTGLSFKASSALASTSAQPVASPLGLPLASGFTKAAAALGKPIHSGSVPMSQAAEVPPEVLQKASDADVARNQSAAQVARSTFMFAKMEKEPDILQRETAPPKSLPFVEPAQPTSAAAIGESKLYRARSVWESDSDGCSLGVEVAAVGQREPQWEAWKIEPELQLVPRVVALAPLERHVLVCGERAGDTTNTGGGCAIIACRPDRNGVHSTWEIPAVPGGPGARHAAWHPLSGNHLVVLSADNVIRVYNTSASMTDPEQEVELGDADEDELTTFCFADVPMVAQSAGESTSGSCGWEHLTLYAVSKRGMVFGACPVLPYNCFIPLTLLAHAAEQTMLRHAGSSDDPDAIREASWLSAISGKSYQRIVAVATGQLCADHSAVRVSKPTSREHRQVQLQRVCEARPDGQWCGLTCLHGTSGTTVCARISTAGLLDIVLSMDTVQPSWQQFRKSRRQAASFIDFEEHVIGSTAEARPEKLSQLHGKVWKQRDCVVTSRDNRWSMEVSEDGECIMTAQLQDVRLTERYGQSQLPEEARQEAKFSFALEGRVWDRRREHFLFTKWVFGTAAEQTRKKWTDQLSERISSASNFDSFPPYQLQSSRIFRGLIVASAKGWHTVSLPWMRELDAAASAGIEAADLELSPTQLDVSTCGRISGCIIATSISQRERLGAHFLVVAGQQSGAAKLLPGNFWTPTAATKVNDAGKEWAERIEALTSSVAPKPAALPPATDASSLAAFGPSFGTIRAWVDQAGEADDAKMITKRTYRVRTHPCSSSFRSHRLNPHRAVRRRELGGDRGTTDCAPRVVELLCEEEGEYP